jgi:farnesyl-diphosphate farnesyltransferase
MESQDEKTCWELLPKVSRSFALCIKILPKPLNSQMMVSYLIYRIIDTIEDSKAPLATKKELFSEFVSLFSSRALDGQKARDCSAKLLSKLNYTYEENLLRNADTVLRFYYSQPAKARASIRKWGGVMARGMFEFQEKRIETFADQNRYSYYVAGVIGYLFNDLLFINGIVSRELKAKLRKYAKKFGLALQKVNILRDIAEDIRSGRHYWPRTLIAKYRLSYESLCLKENREKAMEILNKQIEDARQYLYAAMKYVLLLPEKAVRVRMFCLIPLFMAIESYAKCVGNNNIFDGEQKVKITREQVGEIVAKSGALGSSNEKLARWFLDSMVNSCPDFVREEYARGLSARD